MRVTLKMATFAVINKLEATTLIGHLAQVQLPNIYPGKITLTNQITVIIHSNLNGRLLQTDG